MGTKTWEGSLIGLLVLGCFVSTLGTEKCVDSPVSGRGGSAASCSMWIWASPYACG